MSTSKKIIDIVPQEIRQQCPTYEDYVNFCRNQQPIFVLYIPVMPHTLLCQAQPDKNDLVDFNFFNIEGIRGYYKELDNGELIRLVNAEDIAIGAGLDKKEIDRRRPVGPHVGRQSTEYLEYNKIRWDRFNQYAEDSLEFLREVVSPSVFGYIHLPIKKDSYIPIELAISVIICCRSEQAKKFQAIVSVKIASEISKLNDIKHRKNIQNISKQLEEQINLMNKTREYYENFNSTKHCFTITEIAKEYGLTAQTLNSLLNKFGIIFPVNNTWQLYAEYARFGYTTNRNENGIVNTYWTANGRWFINIVLERYGIFKDKDNTSIVNTLLID